ncbi:hypothetical protein CU098_004117, partial [Rhizopus stolonifer]
CVVHFQTIMDWEDLAAEYEKTHQMEAEKASPQIKMKKWNEMLEKGEQENFLKPKNFERPAKLQAEHTAFIFDLVKAEPTTSVDSVAPILCEAFENLEIGLQTVNDCMRNQVRVSYKRTQTYATN